MSDIPNLMRRLPLDVVLDILSMHRDIQTVRRMEARRDQVRAAIAARTRLNRLRFVNPNRQQALLLDNLHDCLSGNRRPNMAAVNRVRAGLRTMSYSSNVRARSRNRPLSDFNLWIRTKWGIGGTQLIN